MSKRSDSKTCSDKCRKDLSRRRKKVKSLFKEITSLLRSDNGTIEYMQDIGDVTKKELDILYAILETMPLTVTPAGVTLIQFPSNVTPAGVTLRKSDNG